MPRQNRGSAAPPRRPVAAPARPAAPQQTRQASTVAQPPQQHAQPPAPAPVQQSSGGGSGLFGQMASTAAGVAVGSSIGHAIGGFFGGGSSSAPAPAEQSQVAAQSADQYQSSEFQAPGGLCQAQVGDFRRCMNDNGSDLTICGWYLDQLKACQSAASRY